MSYLRLLSVQGAARAVVSNIFAGSAGRGYGAIGREALFP